MVLFKESWACFSAVSAPLPAEAIGRAVPLFAPLPILTILTPAPALGFGDPGTASLRFRPGRQSTMKAAARFPELDAY